VHHRYSRTLPIIFVAALTLASCGGGGGGGGGSSVPPPQVTPTPTPVPGSTTTLSPTAGSNASATLEYQGVELALSVPITTASAGAAVTITMTPTEPIAYSLPYAHLRKPKYVSPNSEYLLFNVTSGSFTTSQTPTVTFTGLAQSGPYTLGEFTENNATASIVPVATGTATSGTVTFAPTANGLSFSSGVYLFVLSPGTAAAPTPTPVAEAAYQCPTSDSVEMVARNTSTGGREGSVRHPMVRGRATAAATGLIDVTYDRATALAAPASIALRETALGAHLVHSFDFAHSGRQTHVLAVPAAQVATVEAGLRGQPGVRSVSSAGYRRKVTTVSQRYYTGDPFFDGFTSAQNTIADNPAPSTYEVAPYSESAVVPGQWDMHAIGLDYAFDYTQSGNGSGVNNVYAIGSSAIKIAIIDTGEDPTHPELSSKIAYQHCYVSDENNVQSSSNFETDPMGHGTDTAGIAVADTSNNLGFVGAGGNSELLAYRVFPVPDDTCETAESDDQCGASTTDIASAIEDAIAQHANVISMSVGGEVPGENTGCSSPGVDSDTTEGQAVADAIAANVIVVAAAGNDYENGLDAPGCDAGVIAVGATSLDDGQSNGTGHTGGTATTPIEYVASYSDYDATNPGNVKSPAAWGIVAPGGDPNGASDFDNLHWIENLWTSTPYMSSPSDTTYMGFCMSDYPNTTSVTPPADCRTLIAGTSMATPHVAGAAALILAVNPSYQSPAKMRQLLCETADDIGDPHQGCGRLNIYRAMAVALGDSNPP
jgi:subtilisin family serine protease